MAILRFLPRVMALLVVYRGGCSFSRNAGVNGVSVVTEDVALMANGEKGW